MSKKSEWFNFLKVLGPLILSMTPGVPPTLIPVIVAGMQKAEELGKPGVEKKEVAMDLVHLGVTGVNAAKGATVIDPVLVDDAVSAGIDTTIAVMKLVEGTPVKTSPAPTGEVDAEFGDLG